MFLDMYSNLILILYILSISTKIYKLIFIEALQNGWWIIQ